MEGSDSSSTIQLAGTVMVIAIIVLFIVVVFILFLHLYAKWFWWHTEEPMPPPPRLVSRRRGRGGRQFVFAQDEDNPVRNGLDLAVLRSLPVVVFQAEEYKDGLECAVCLCDVEEGEKARLLPGCNHGFHVECIDMWFQSHSTCPLCRSKVAPLLQSSEGDDGTDDWGRDGLEGGNGPSLEEVFASGSSLELASFPTNVLVWGDETQVSTSGVNGGSTGFCLELEEGTSGGHVNSMRRSFSASSSDSDGVLVVDIPEQMGESLAEQESSKSLAPTRLRSFRRLLSWEKRAVAPNPSSSEEV